MNYFLFGERGFVGSALKPFCKGSRISPVWINAMAVVQGIGGNRLSPATLLVDNLKSAIQVFDQATASDSCKRIVNFGSTCAYSPQMMIPFQPQDYLRGFPETTNLGYAIAKRTIYSMSCAYSEQYDMDNLYLVMPNLYGPGCHFGPNSHVIPDMISKVQAALDSNATEIVFLGTGAAEREFLFIGDAVTLILKAIEEVHTQDPVHLTSGQVITIKNLAELICRIMGFSGVIHWDSKFPDGQLKRQLAKGLEPMFPMPLEVGISQTVQFFRSIQKELQARR